MIRQAVFIDTWETTTSYTFSQIQLNPSLSPTDFTFDPSRYPNLQIEDKR
jgi:outer membrane lipoprotein-sorting protein